MKATLTLLTALAFGCLLPARAADVDGKWKSEFDSQIGHQKYVFELKADGEKLTGKAVRDQDGSKSETEITDGKITGTEVSFAEVLHFDDQQIRIAYHGNIEGDRMKLSRKPGDFDSLDIVATRETGAATANSDKSPAKKIKLTVIKVDSEETAGEDGRGANAVDGDTATIWHTQWQDATPPLPHEIIIELDPPSRIKGFTYLPRQDTETHGDIKDYEFYLSDDGKDFGQPVKKGTFDESKEKKTVNFEPKQCRYVKLKALSEVAGEDWTSAAEITVIPE